MCMHGPQDTRGQKSPQKLESQMVVCEEVLCESNKHSLTSASSLQGFYLPVPHDGYLVCLFLFLI